MGRRTPAVTADLVGQAMRSVGETRWSTAPATPIIDPRNSPRTPVPGSFLCPRAVAPSPAARQAPGSRQLALAEGRHRQSVPGPKTGWAHPRSAPPTDGPVANGVARFGLPGCPGLNRFERVATARPGGSPVPGHGKRMTAPTGGRYRIDGNGTFCSSVNASSKPRR